MAQSDPQPFIDRTSAKLNYARLHLSELSNHPSRGKGDEFERAHQESFLYHLLGAREAFLQEINIYYGCDLSLRKVRLKDLRQRLAQLGKQSPELSELVAVEADPKSWLSVAKELRDHATHRQTINRVYHIEGAELGPVYLTDPRDGQAVPKDVLEAFDSWLEEMSKSIDRWRTSAKSQMI